MNARDLAEIASEEVAERMTKAYLDMVDACTDECPLTPQQKRIVGTALLRESMGFREDLQRMFTNAAVLEKWATPLADEMERWLSEQDGRRH